MISRASLLAALLGGADAREILGQGFQLVIGIAFGNPRHDGGPGGVAVLELHQLVFKRRGGPVGDGRDNAGQLAIGTVAVGAGSGEQRGLRGVCLVVSQRRQGRQQQRKGQSESCFHGVVCPD